MICPACGPLKDVECSYSKYGAPEYDRPLPAAAAGLIVMNIPAEPDPEKRHVRRCPVCGALYAYLSWHEYVINGTEDEEELTRMAPSDVEVCLRAKCLPLELLRREIENTEDSASSMGGYLDRGNPSSEEVREMMDAMQACGKQARELRAQLEQQVVALRKAWPELLAFWAAVHMRVGREFLGSIPSGDEDRDTARHVAGRILQAWSALPVDGETFVAGDEVWLPGYSKRVDELLQITTPA